MSVTYGLKPDGQTTLVWGPPMSIRVSHTSDFSGTLNNILSILFIGMEELIYKLNGVRMLDVVEEEMIQLWLRNDTIPYLLKEDEEFVSVVTSAIMLEKGFGVSIWW